MNTEGYVLSTINLNQLQQLVLGRSNKRVETLQTASSRLLKPERDVFLLKQCFSTLFSTAIHYSNSL